MRLADFREGTGRRNLGKGGIKRYGGDGENENDMAEREKIFH